nr:alpha/beta hydrolase [Candidatus Gracilibacteria bacterium]
MEITLKGLAITVVSIYVFFCIYLYLSQKSMIYLPSHQDFYECNGFKYYDKLFFNGTRFYIKNKSDNVIVVYHGNAGSACDLSNNLKKVLEETDYSLVFVEYAGYSNDSYSPSIMLLKNDVENIKAYLNIKNFKKVIVYGRSLGTALAAYQSSISNVDKLILVSPFTTFLDLIKSKYPIFPINYMLTERYDNVEYLKNFKNNILIIHGNKDIDVPYKFGKDLYNTLTTKNKEFITIPGKGHNDLENDDSFYKKIMEFINK